MSGEFAHVVDLPKQRQPIVGRLVVFPYAVDLAPAAGHVALERVAGDAVDAVLVAVDHRRVGRHRQYRPERVQQHVGGDGFAEVDIPNVFAFDWAVVNLGKIEAAPRFFVLRAAAGADPHDIGGDAGIGFFLFNEEKAAGNDGRALAGAFPVGRGVAAGGVAEGYVPMPVGAAFGAEPLGG